MDKTEPLEVTTPSDREIVMTYVFDAPRELVLDAPTKLESGVAISYDLLAERLAVAQEP